VKAPFAALTTLLLTAVAAELALVQPKDLAAELGRSSKPVILQVGPNVLYRSHHIAGALYAGPASKQEGLDLLTEAVKDLPRDRQIVIYCGCCPWDRCPNIKPAAEALAKLGFTHVRSLYIPTNFKTDWIDRNYPVEPAR
jgi:thiosulfate/3-mercaptopyruvate sulfurtransferase